MSRRFVDPIDNTLKGMYTLISKFGWRVEWVMNLYLPQYFELLKLIKWENKEVEKSMKRKR